VKKYMPSSDKLESDYQGFIKKVEQTAVASLEKIRSDLDALRNQAAKYDGAA
jgi:hypothetical protein